MCLWFDLEDQKWLMVQEITTISTKVFFIFYFFIEN